MKIWIFILFVIAAPVGAQDLETSISPAGEPVELDREPAAVQTSIKRRAYPGGADEEDLRVLAALPEASIKTDARSVQREVYKQLYNQELKEEQQNDLEE